MEPIIQSILDNDLYKFTMQQAILELFPGAKVEYRFKNRGKQRFTLPFLRELKKEIKRMSKISLSKEEYSWIKSNIPFFKPQFVEFLKNYRYNSNNIDVSLDKNQDLQLSIKGYWYETVLWEVPLMALISELYFTMIDTDWKNDDAKIANKVWGKINILTANECFFADFGTRRRRKLEIQDTVVNVFKNYSPPVTTEPKISNSFVGTSNVYFAMKYGVKPIGTYAHEWIMGNSVLEGLRNANYFSMQNWKRVYCSNLGIALTDTYGTDAFLKNFTLELSKVYDGVRHDSGCPFKFTDKMVKHYKKMGIDPMSKTIVFSDGLNVAKAIEIKKYCKGEIKCSFGIGTHFTNDFTDSSALNMVIKLWSVNGVNVVKLSDDAGKEMGDSDAVTVAKWTFLNQPIENLK